MKFYLSSFRLGDAKDQLAQMAAGARRVAFVANALDYFEDQSKKDSVIARDVNDLLEIGLVCDLIDLRQYFGSVAALRNRIKDHRVLFFTGGNCFILRRALRQSGLDSYLLEKKHQSDFIYAGYSAGACVCSPTLRGLDKVDDPNEAPDGYCPDVIWDGLGLIDYNIVPHFQSRHHESSTVKAVMDYWTENKIPFRALRDGEVIVHE